MPTPQKRRLRARRWNWASDKDLEAVQAAGEKLRIRVLGLAIIADDVTPDLAQATIDSITVLGALHASAEVKTALADRLS
jgi:Ribbon-Helix-Helix transcriptional regulator family